ncbi:TraR/DksA family transcriptional regulator [Aquihabitans sp. McL0605]|uniref:TraR/DksA family transcriptional regulator n=1 Tax=Aquihabitans sp. McL0605 TaxID=3415671 RepID=UPI003CFB25B4
MASTDLTTLRDTLESERAELARQLEELSEGGAAPDANENFADSAQVTAEHVENRTLAATLQDQLSDVESAIDRIDAGAYGRCEVCQKPVSAARLEAMPSTRFCIDHA